VVDDPGVCQSVTLARCAEQIDVLPSGDSWVSKKQSIRWHPHPHGEGKGVWCGLCQITLATCLNTVFDNWQNLSEYLKFLAFVCICEINVLQTNCHDRTATLSVAFFDK